MSPSSGEALADYAAGPFVVRAPRGSPVQVDGLLEDLRVALRRQWTRWAKQRLEGLDAPAP